MLAFLALLSFSVDFATFLGGLGNDYVHAVAATPDGSTLVIGRTGSFGPPFTEGPPGSSLFEVGYLARWDRNGKQAVMRRIPEGIPRALAVDRDGNAYLAGNIQNRGFPTTPGAFKTSSATGLEAFVMKVSPQGEILSSTLFGERYFTTALSLALDEAGNPTFCGYGLAGDIPVTGALLFDPPASFGPGTETSYCATLSADLSRLLFSALLGGSRWSSPRAAALDSSGNLYVGGLTTARDLPMRNAFQETDHRRTLFRRGADGVWTAMGDKLIGTAYSILFVRGLVYAAGGPDRWISEDGGDHWRLLARSNWQFNAPTVAHPLNPGFVCAASGGDLYCSTNFGATYTRSALISRINQVVPDPKVEGGFYVATDAGVAYVNLAGGPRPRIASPWGRTYSIAVDGTGDQNVLWVVASWEGAYGLFRSADGGATYEMVTDRTLAAGVEAAKSGVIYTVKVDTYPWDPPLRRSVDGGRTWADVGRGLPRKPTRLVADPASPSTVYALIYDSPYRSDDGGDTWRPLVEPGLNNRSIATLEFDAEGNLWAGSFEPANGFLMKINPKEPALEFSTLLGGMGGGSINSVRVDPAGRVLVSGSTNGSDLPVTDSDLVHPFEATNVSFWGLFDQEGRLSALRHIGNGPAFLDIDGQGRIHLAQQATVLLPGASEPVVRGEPRGGGDALWLVLDPTASAVTHATWFGGWGSDAFTAIAIGADGRVRLAGPTTSRDLPVSENASQPQAGGSNDGFLLTAPVPD